MESKNVTGFYKKILLSNGVNEDVSEVTMKDAGLQGEGLASATSFVTVKFTDSKVRDLNLFVKQQTNSASHRSMMQEMKAFEKEARFLTEYVPAAKEFCKSKGMNGFIDFYPKCYFADSNMIVLENLVLDKGLVLLKRADMQDLETASLGMKVLAKHHALSYAMIQNEGGLTNFSERFPNLGYDGMSSPLLKDLSEPVYNNTVDININILEKSNVEGGADAVSYLEQFKGKTFQLSRTASEFDEKQDSLILLLHGDYQNNNMMFSKNSATGKVDGLVAIDLQGIRYNAPAVDLTYYIFSSVKPEVRRIHLQDLLNIYLDTFTETTVKLGHPINYSYDQLFQDFQRRLDAGYWIGMTFSCGPAMAVFKEVDVGKIDVRDWGRCMLNAVERWLQNNPDEARNTAELLVKVVDEYKTLTLK